MNTELLFYVLILLFAFIIAYKVRKIQIFLDKLECIIHNDKDVLFLQIESLLSLYNDLKFSQGLPSTRGWAGSPDFLLSISRIAQSKKPMTIIECSSGVSTVVLSQCCKLNGKGHVYSLEHDPSFAEKTRTELIRHNLNDFATIINAPLKNYSINDNEWNWYSLDYLPKNLKFDMIVIDGPPYSIQKLARYPATILISMLNESGIVILDDADRDDEKEIVEMWEQEFPDLKKSYFNCEKGCVLLEL